MAPKLIVETKSGISLKCFEKTINGGGTLNIYPCDPEMAVGAVVKLMDAAFEAGKQAARVEMREALGL